MFDPKNHYEVLEIQADANPQEIRAAYLKLKEAYSRDSIALHGLMGEDEPSAMLERIEEAYAALSDPTQKTRYDQAFDGIETSNADDMESLLVAPAIPISGEKSYNQIPLSQEALGAPSLPQFIEEKKASPVSVMPSLENALRAPNLSVHSSFDHSTANTIQTWIASETEWGGEFLRRIREARGMTIVDVAERTRISKTYIGAIEGEDDKKLPVSVYVRGFVQQIARELKLPIDRVVTGYMARYTARKGPKAS